MFNITVKHLNLKTQMASSLNWIEYLTTNQAVEGSNPSEVTILFVQNSL